MNAFFFGTGRRRLFGAYSPGRASATGAAGRAAVLCNPFGQEYLRAHRSMRQLGNLLNGIGVHVLRFDYFGTGDSAGEMTEADLAGWRSDIETALEELKDATDARRVGLVGLRLGASLAAEVAAGRKDIDRLVLWDPVDSGAAYLQELVATSPPPLERPPQKGGGFEVMGFPLTAQLCTDLKQLTLAPQLARLPARSLLMRCSQRSGPETGLGNLSCECVESQPAWLEDGASGAGAIPVKLLQRIAAWWA
jgi:pimeloyl-ACP methyl ester carboxylesterase